jgi:phospholipid/cholesterol/gamma-HCH transport system substrate-binding protein
MLTAGGGETRTVLGRVLACVDTLVGRTTAGSGTMGRALSDPSLYANADSLVMVLRALVADVKANPKRYVNIRLF